jgi:hypothetical protein
MSDFEDKRELYREIYLAKLSAWRVKLRHTLFERTARNVVRAGGMQELEELDKEPLDKFEVVVLIGLMINMILMAFYQPLNPNSDITVAVRWINLVLSCFFAFEAGIRLAAFGHYVFIRDPWNMIDLVVIVVSVVSASLDIGGISIGSFSMLRTIRVFRPLRSVVTFPALRLLVVAMIGAVRSLWDVALMYLLFLTSFSIIGVSQFSGLLQARCISDTYWTVKLNASSPGARLLTNFTLSDFVCGGAYDEVFGESLRQDCSPSQVCDLVTDGRLLDGFRCPWGYRCTPLENPYFGMISFDSLPQALLTLFVSVTGELWYNLSAMLMDAFDITAAYYFIAVLFLGNFFIVNLSIVLITISFESTTAFQMQKVSRLLRRKPRARSDSQSSSMTTHTARLRNKRLRALSTRRSNVSYDADLLPAANSFSSAATALLQREAAGAAFASPHSTFDTIDDGAEPYLGYSDASPFADAAPLATDQLPLWSDHTETAKKFDAQWELAITKVPLVSKLRNVVQTWFDRDYISHVVNGLIVLNILCMATQHYGQPDALGDFLSTSNLVFTSFFILEFVVRVLHFGPHRYFRKPVNVLDFIVLIVSIVDVSSLGSQFPSIRAFRSVRLLKVLKSFPSVLRWAVVIMVSLKASFLLMVTIFVFNYVAACFAMQLFGGEFCDLAYSDIRPDNTVPACPNRPRANFDTIGQALLTSFQVMTGDDWDLVMYNAMRAVHPLVALGFVGYFIVSSYVLVNILIGILLSGPSPAEVNSLGREIFEANLATGHVESETEMRNRLAIEQAAWQEEQDNMARQMNEVVITADGVMLNVSTMVTNQRQQQPNVRADADEGAFSETTRLWRERLRWFLTHHHFETAMLWLILLSCIAMAFEDPLLAPDTGRATLLRNTDIIVTAVFVVEVIANCIAFGVVFDAEAYLRRDPWNAVDFLVVLLSLLGVVGEYAIGKRWLRVALSVRAIRPLRFVKRSLGLRTVFQAFVRSVVPLRNILVLGLMIWTCWGLMGVQLFMGTFYSCSDASYRTKPECLNHNESWVNAPLHFDHLAAAFLALFSVASLDGWSKLMVDGMDSVAPEVAPVVNNRPAVAMYFVSFVLVGSYFLVNLVVSVVIDTYNQEKQRLGDRCVYLSESQNAYVRSHRRMIRGVPQIFFDRDTVPQWRMRLRELVASKPFRYASMTCIVVNCLLMTLVYHDAPEELLDALLYCSAIFAAAFAAEATCKIAAVGFAYYIESRFNRFDLFITVLCVVGVLGELSFASAGFRFIFRVMRVASLFRLMRNAATLRRIIGRFSFALYGLVNVAALLFLCLFIYAVMGMRSFGLVRWQANITQQFNFTNFLRSVLLLLRIITGGDWTGFMDDCAVDTPSCDDQINDCGVNVFSQIYYVTFMAVTYFVLVNLFIAVILDCFVATNYSTETISKDHVKEFFDRWFDIDTKQEMRIPGRCLLLVLRSIAIDNPLGLGYVPIELRARHEFAFVRALRLREIDGHIELQSLVMSLCRFVFGVSLPDFQVAKLQAQADHRFRRYERERRRGAGEYRSVPAIQRVAVVIIEARWIDFLRHKRSRALEPTVALAGAGTVAGDVDAAARLRDLNSILGENMSVVDFRERRRDTTEDETLPTTMRAALALLRREAARNREPTAGGHDGADPTSRMVAERLLGEASTVPPTHLATALIRQRAEAARAEDLRQVEGEFYMQALRQEAEARLRVAPSHQTLHSRLLGDLSPREFGDL